MAPRPAASIVGSTARASLNEPVRLILGINHALGQLAPTQRDQPLQRQVSYGSERALAEPALLQQLPNKRAALWVLQPGADCAARGQRR